MSDRTVIRDVPGDPPCPNCGRRYATKFVLKGAQHARFFCDPTRAIGGCGKEWQPK